MAIQISHAMFTTYKITGPGVPGVTREADRLGNLSRATQLVPGRCRARGSSWGSLPTALHVMHVLRPPGLFSLALRDTLDSDIGC